MTPDSEHCLRPVFTKGLLKTLLAGGAVNLIGPAGSGRGRLIEDLRYCAPADRPVLHADMKSWRASHEGFIAHLSLQLGTGAGKKPADIGVLAERLRKKGPGALLLLHHFDALLDNPDVHSAFGVGFFNHLNSLRNQGIALLCVTEKPHDNSVVFVDGKPHGASWLDLQVERVPALRWEELRAEIRRRLVDPTDAELAALIEAVRKDEAPYALLDFMLRELARPGEPPVPFKRRIRLLKRYFRAHGRGGHLGVWYKRLHRASTALRGFLMASGLNRLRLPLPVWLKALLPKDSDGPAKPRDP
jgi:hypothetical protein